MKDFLRYMTCGRLHNNHNRRHHHHHHHRRHHHNNDHYASSFSAAASASSSSRDTGPSVPAPEIQSIYEVESLRPISVHIEKDPEGSWHSDLYTILHDFGKEPGHRTPPPASSIYSSEHRNTPTVMSSPERVVGLRPPLGSDLGAAAAGENHQPPGPLITGLHHINITVPDGALALATSFYAETLGLTPRPVPAAQVDELVWLDIGTSGQQVHISVPKHEGDTAPHNSSRHPCFKVGSPEALVELQRRIYGHWLRGGEDAPLAADAVGESSGSKGKEYPTRFFARDFAGNRLEFTV